MQTGWTPQADRVRVGLVTITESKEALLEKWFEQTLATYASQTLRFLHGEKDPFRNPVGHILRANLATLVEEITGQMNAARIQAALENIVRLRAVQDFTPSQAVSFVYLLRDILPKESPSDVQRRIDELALLAFDLYMKCREEIYDIKAREARRKVYVLERIGQRTCGE